MNTQETSQTESVSQPTQAVDSAQAANLRRKKKAEGRKKRAVKLSTNKEFAKTYFEAKSKRSNDKKSTFRKKKSKKK